MSSATIGLGDDLAQYHHIVGFHDDSVLHALRQETSKMPAGGMQICPAQGAFMSNLVRILSVKNTLEVGTFTGYSTLVVAAALPDDGQVIACDVSEEWTSVAR